MDGLPNLYWPKDPQGQEAGCHLVKCDTILQLHSIPSRWASKVNRNLFPDVRIRGEREKHRDREIWSFCEAVVGLFVLWVLRCRGSKSAERMNNESVTQKKAKRRDKNTSRIPHSIPELGFLSPWGPLLPTGVHDYSNKVPLLPKVISLSTTNID